MDNTIQAVLARFNDFNRELLNKQEKLINDIQSQQHQPRESKIYQLDENLRKVIHQKVLFETKSFSFF